MIATSSKRGRAALMVAHCAGMVDLVALPVWVGTLISRYGLGPQQAGLLATLFLASAVLASVVTAARFQRLLGRGVAVGGFAVTAVAFGLASTQQAMGPLALLHALAGLGAGAALSVTHGTIARSANPHRLFALVGIALGFFAVVFLAATPQLVAAFGGPTLFVVFGGVMAVAVLAAAIGFPVPDAPAQPAAGSAGPAQPIPRVVWFGIVGIAGMALSQAMTFSFLERVGMDRGFGAAAVSGVLIALGLVNLCPSVLAAVLEKRLDPRKVLIAGALLQALFVALIMNSTVFAPYALAASVFSGVIIFSHTFAFGLLARLEPSGRALAATPAMMMIGGAIGPVLGGTLVKGAGYAGISVAAAVIAAVAVFCFLQLRPAAAPQPHPAAA